MGITKKMKYNNEFHETLPINKWFFATYVYMKFSRGYGEKKAWNTTTVNSLHLTDSYMLFWHVYIIYVWSLRGWYQKKNWNITVNSLKPYPLISNESSNESFLRRINEIVWVVGTKKMKLKISSSPSVTSVRNLCDANISSGFIPKTKKHNEKFKIPYINFFLNKEKYSYFKLFLTCI